MNLMILTAACWPSEEEARRRLWIFLKSCERYGISEERLRLYGCGTPQFLGYRQMKLDTQLSFLRANPEDFSHVLYTDSLDAFFTGSYEEIVAKYLAMNASVVYSAYWQLGNESNAEINYPGCFDETIRNKYPNVGGYVGELPAVIDLLERMMALPRQTGDDCFNLYDLWKDGFRAKLDSNAEIFQVSTDDCMVKAGRLHNSRFNTDPCIYHLSGGYCDQVSGKDDRLKPWARELGVIE